MRSIFMADEDATLEQADQEVETPEAELSDDERFMADLKKAVEVESEDIATLRRRLTITIPRDTIDERLEEQLSEKRREEVIPGFRRGRAPLRLVQKRFGREIGNELSARLVLSAYLAVLERDEIKTVGDPMLWATVPPPKGSREDPKEKLLEPSEAIRHIKLPSEGALTFKCEVDLQPEFELPSLEGIEVTRPAVSVSDKDVDNEVKRLLAMRGHFAPVDEKKKIVEDDLIVGDLKVTVGDKLVKSEENVQVAARDMRYGGILLEGLGRALIGQKAGATVTLDTKIPDEYPEDDLRGQDARVDLVVHDVKRLVIPELDQELLESMGFESEGDLRDLIHRELEAGLDAQVTEALRDQIDEHLLANTELEIPAGISASHTERVVALQVIERLQEGVPEAEITKEIDSLRTTAAEAAARHLKLSFILEKIAEDREIDVGEDEINGVINEIARRRQMRFDRVRDELIASNRLQALYLRLRNDKIRDALLQDAKIADAPAKAKKTKQATSRKRRTSSGGRSAPSKGGSAKSKE
jgi:trigger factor